MGKTKQDHLLASEVRRTILTLLRERDLSAGEISEALRRPRPGVSHHLATLLDAGLVRFRADGAHRFYGLVVEATLAAWDDYLSAPARSVEASHAEGEAA